MSTNEPRKIWWPLFVFGGLFGVLVLLLRCGPEEGSNQAQAGTWFSVRPPPSAPEGTTCWVWQSGLGSQATGGPVCFEPK